MVKMGKHLNLKYTKGVQYFFSDGGHHYILPMCGIEAFSETLGQGYPFSLYEAYSRGANFYLRRKYKASSAEATKYFFLKKYVWWEEG